MPTRAECLHALIAQQRQIGLNPQEIHANQATVESFTVEAGLKPSPTPDTRSYLARLRAPEDRPAPRYEFDGLRLVSNPVVPGAAMLLRPAILMDDPMWIQKHVVMSPVEKVGVQTMPAEGTPWHEKVPKSADDLGDDKDTLEMLNAAGGITPSSIVMKAMEGIDFVDGIIILRFKRGDVELCSTFDRLSVMGALQDALSYVMRQGQ